LSGITAAAAKRRGGSARGNPHLGEDYRRTQKNGGTRRSRSRQALRNTLKLIAQLGIGHLTDPRHVVDS
jgi:hypothetical protein